MTVVVQDSAYIEKLMVSLERMWAASDYAKLLSDKAKIVAPKARKTRADIQKEMSDITKNLWDGILPGDVDACVKLYAERNALTKKINSELKKKGCDTAVVRTYNEAAELYEADARIAHEAASGKPVKPSAELEPNILARIELKRAEQRKKSKSQ